MKIAVIDDEKPQADILYSICNAYFGGHKQNVQIDCFPDGIAFFQFIQGKHLQNSLCRYFYGEDERHYRG